MHGETDTTVRPLKPDDLDAVVDIDHRISGRSRRLFFEKRLDAALATSRGFIAVAVEDGSGVLRGFAIARIQDGEFGDNRRVAVVDVLGVDPDSQHAGCGASLLAEIESYGRKFGIAELRTQVDWAQSELLGFFAASGFELAPIHAYERVTERNL